MNNSIHLLTDKFCDIAYMGEIYTPQLDGTEDIVIPADAPIGKRCVTISLKDGTVINYSLKIIARD